MFYVKMIKSYFFHKCKNESKKKLPLPTWFIIVGLMLNSKTGILAKEFEQNTGIHNRALANVSMAYNLLL